MGEGETTVVKVGQLPGKVQEVTLEAEVVPNVQTVIQILALRVEGYEIRVGGELANLQTLLKSGDTVLFVRKIQGN